MGQDKKKDTVYDRLAQELNRYPSEARLTLMRNVAFGSAAVCLAIVLLIVQLPTNEAYLNTSLSAAAVGIPLWLVFGWVLEYYIFLGARSYPHHRKMIKAFVLGAIILLPAVATGTSVLFLLWYRLPAAMGWFVASMILGAAILLAFYIHLSHWWAINIDSRSSKDVQREDDAGQPPQD